MECRVPIGQNRDGTWSAEAPWRITAATRDELIAEVNAACAFLDKKVGRVLTLRELVYGIAHPDERTELQKMEAIEHRRCELNPPPPLDTRTPERRNADMIKQRADEERLAALPTLQREAELAERKAQEADARAVQDALRDEARSRPSFQKLTKALELFASDLKFDPTVSAEMVEEAEHQIRLLNEHLDAATATANLKSLQAVYRDKKSLQSSALKESANRIDEEIRKHSYDPVWDEPVQSFMVGSVEHFRLKYKGKTVNVSKGLYDGRTPEQLIRNCFPDDDAAGAAVPA